MDFSVKWDISIKHYQFCRIFQFFIEWKVVHHFDFVSSFGILKIVYVFQFKPGKNLQKSVADGSFSLFSCFGLENGESFSVTSYITLDTRRWTHHLVNVMCSKQMDDVTSSVELMGGILGGLLLNWWVQIFLWTARHLSFLFLLGLTRYLEKWGWERRRRKLGKKKSIVVLMIPPASWLSRDQVFQFL